VVGGNAAVVAGAEAVVGGGATEVVVVGELHPGRAREAGRAGYRHGVTWERHQSGRPTAKPSTRVRFPASPPAADLVVTLDRYGHLFPELDEAIATAFDEQLRAVRAHANRDG
jgi:hypothetical protein